MNFQTFMYLLALLFIGLQLTNYIAWPWWVVTAPLWALPALQFLGGVVIGFVKAYNARRALRTSQ